MKPQPGSFVYQSEFSTDHQGRRWQKVWRRRVLTLTDDRLALSGAELMTVPLDAPGDYDWQRCSGMLGMDLGLSIERFHERGFSTSFRLGRGAA
ncbi:MAG TPA: hypothetical protein DD491_15960 [Halieaceae bacterium]|nr:hypothetical protein [Halieaceae bacterium]